MHGRVEKCSENVVRNLKETDHLGDLAVDGRII
jgi:hypothetical protein